MSFIVTNTMFGALHKFGLDTNALAAIVGDAKPDLMDCSGALTFDDNYQLVLTNGLFFKIVYNNIAYTICPTEFSQKVGSNTIKSNGTFNGPTDEVGKKLINLFFANHSDGSVVYRNGAKCKLIRNESFIELVP